MNQPNPSDRMGGKADSTKAGSAKAVSATPSDTASEGPLVAPKAHKPVVYSLGGLGSVNQVTRAKMEEWASSAGMPVDEAMRRLLIWSVEHVSPATFLESTAPSVGTDVACVSKTLNNLGVPRKVWLVQLQLDPTTELTMVRTWNIILRALRDTHNQSLQELHDGSFVVTAYSDNQKLKEALVLAGVINTSFSELQRLSVKTPDVSPEAPQFLVPPDKLVSFVKRSQEMVEKVATQIAAAKQKHGRDFLGVDDTVPRPDRPDRFLPILTMDDVLHIRRIKSTCLPELRPRRQVL